MWYRLAKEPEKQSPRELEIALGMFARNAIINLLRFKQRNYAPEPKIINSMMKRFFKQIDERYGGASNFVLYVNGMSLKNLVDQNVNDLFGKKHGS